MSQPRPICLYSSIYFSYTLCRNDNKDDDDRNGKCRQPTFEIEIEIDDDQRHDIPAVPPQPRPPPPPSYVLSSSGVSAID
jgi:hypothetical protein